MRIVTLNIWFGGGGTRRFQRILETLAGLEPDLVGLQECLGWDEGDRLGQTARALGLPHTFLGLARPRGSGQRYHVALLSRWPIEQAVSYADPAVNAHCLVRARVEGLDLLVTHLDGHDEDLRLAEARWLNGLGAQAGPAVLAADLNSLSPHDPYPDDLGEQLRQAGVAKYGPGVRREVMAELAAAGWRDPLYRWGPPPVWVTGSRAGIPFRTDYTLVSPDLADRLESCRVVPVDEQVSDHCPVVLDLAPPAATGRRQQSETGSVTRIS